MAPPDAKPAHAEPDGTGAERERKARREPTLPHGPEIEQLYQPKVDRAVLGRLLSYARPYRRMLAVAVILLLLVSGGELVFPLLTKRAIDQSITNRDLVSLAHISLLYLVLLLAVFGLRYIQTVLMQTTGQRIMADLRSSLFAHLERLDLTYFEKTPVGRIMTRLTGDVETLNDLFTSGLVSIFGDLLTLFGITGVLFWLNWKLALVILVVVPLLISSTMVFRAKVRTAYALIRVRVAAINAFLQENLTGISLVQLFGRERIQEERFLGLNVLHRDAFIRSVLYYSIYFPIVEFLESLALALILWYGGGEALRHALTLGSLVAFVQYSERFFRPIRDLSERYNILQSAMASSERVFDLLDTPPRIVSPEAPAEPPSSEYAVEFQDVHFSYVPGEEVLKGISFRVRRGESIALVGHTGAGKTTISALLGRFYDIQKGSILVDGRDVRAWPLSDLRRRIGIVPQEVFLWSGDIRLNIGLRGARDPSQVERAIRLVGIDRLADRFHGGGDGDEPAGAPGTVGERGSQLSVGERQLISFARALAADPPILLLDEATSSVDTESEQRIREALGVLLRGRTSIIIAHRLSTIRHVDRILVLHHGVLVEEGRHDELLRLGGIYARYYELEYRGQESLGEEVPV